MCHGANQLKGHDQKTWNITIEHSRKFNTYNVPIFVPIGFSTVEIIVQANEL